VFIGAAEDDLSAFSGFRTLRGAPLGEVKNLLASSCLFVGNDSGPAHMAAAFGLPVVVIFGNSNPEIWGPWRTAAEVVRAPEGIGGVSVDRVLEALSRLRVHA
jgi:ADP-heptose:LPS heptosyltransferase